MRVRFRAVVSLAVVASLAAIIPIPARSQSSTPTQGATPTSTSTSTLSASPSPSGSASASPNGSPSAAPKPVEAAKPGRSTDTEYIKVKIDRRGRPQAAWLKDWIRLRGGGTRTVIDPATFASIKYLKGTPSADDRDKQLKWRSLGVGGDGVRDLYYEGRLQQAGDYWVTPAGLKPLPLNVQINYYTGDEGSETPSSPTELEGTDVPLRFKIVITLTNMTKRMQELTYTDIQTKKQVTATAPVYTPYVVRIADLHFPDSAYDSLRTDGEEMRDGNSTVVNWTRYLIPPDFKEQQSAIITGVIARGARLPDFKIVAQPVYPPFDAQSLTGEGVQFQRGRRNFFYDVFGLFRENLIALNGLFGLLHDSFANLSIPLLGPEKGNREAGSFDKPNQLWALWTLTKGVEQLDRAFNVFDSTSQLLRDAVKGSMATLQQLRAFIGYSTDKNIIPPPSSAQAALLGSIWSDLKTLATTCGDTSFSQDTRPYFPETPALTCPANPSMAVSLNLIFLKLALVEHDLHSVQKENHTLDTGLLAGLANTPFAHSGITCPAVSVNDRDTAAGQTCNSYNKFLFIKFPFGLEEIERALYTLKTQGFDPLQAALGNKDQPNTLINAMHTLVAGTEAQIDAFHNLGATWRFVADSIQNFALFGIESARNILQWDVNGIDLDTAVKAAEVARAKEFSTFMGRPKDADGEPALGQLVITYSTAAEPDHPKATDSGGGKVAVVLASAMFLAVLAGFGRFRWKVI